MKPVNTNAAANPAPPSDQLFWAGRYCCHAFHVLYAPGSWHTSRWLDARSFLSRARSPVRGSHLDVLSATRGSVTDPPFRCATSARRAFAVTNPMDEPITSELRTNDPEPQRTHLASRLLDEGERVVFHVWRPPGVDICPWLIVRG
jgi:hypothetical protein